MIRVRKGSNEFLVSRKSYEDTFKKLGYSIVDNKEVGVVQSTIPTENTIEAELVEEEKKENELKDNNNDVVTSEDLKSSIGIKVEEDFGFEDDKEEELVQDIKDQKDYQAKLASLKSSKESAKSGK
mgnify:CR=1 FL=1